MNLKLNYLALLGSLLFLLGCGSDLELITVEEYISLNNIEVETTDSGLMYTIDFPGNDQMPTADDFVTVKYKGYRTDDLVFDHNLVDGASFRLTEVIAGWTEGIQLFGKGGTGTLYIPANLAYGNNPPEGSDIPANADIIFDIELVNF